MTHDMDAAPLRVGLSMCLLPRDPARATYNGRPLIYAEESMVRWLMRDPVSLVLLPFTPGASIEETAKHAERQAEQIDALVLHGGSDIAPQAYGQQPLREEWAGDPPRDRYELALFHACMERDIPILGICRGHQLINVALGGTMLQDIQEQHEGAERHRDAETYQHNIHDLEIIEGGLLSELYPDTRHARINSVHHQAIDALADGLDIEAVSPNDDLIEAVRWVEDHRFVLGVQWHPEFQSAGDPETLLPADPLFEEFVRVAREVARRRHRGV
ncbi:MAG: gamma-glutamyl-gamma-aminobutyrate hydrolase family protein [Myxococcota bacterium]|nr:gamma-glutamyl-gamma-aminobutyrate hydrolase family protein [Myxococcota bacterium]